MVVNNLFQAPLWVIRLDQILLVILSSAEYRCKQLIARCSRDSEASTQQGMYAMTTCATLSFFLSFIRDWDWVLSDRTWQAEDRVLNCSNKLGFSVQFNLQMDHILVPYIKCVWLRVYALKSYILDLRLSVVCVHIFCFFFFGRKELLKKNAVSSRSHPASSRVHTHVYFVHIYE